MTAPDFDIFLACPPGLEAVLAGEARAAGFALPETTAGGVTTRGGWPEVWRANLSLRGAGRVLVRIAAFRAFHLAQLDKRARKVPWGDYLRGDVPFRVEAVCRKSKIYHNGAAAQRVARAIGETLGAPEDRDGTVAETVTVMVRIEDNLVTVSLDSSGAPLHKRGHKEAVGKAPLRETLAALVLRACGYDGSEPVVDPMCGSGTFPIEAAEIAMGLAPGRARAFAFERLAGFDSDAWAAMKASLPGHSTELRFHGYDRDAGAVRMATANAARAGVDRVCSFACQPVSALERPAGSPGLVVVNPPYGGRIGNRKLLFGLYGALGAVLKERFRGWRVGLVTNDGGLAKATGLPFEPPGPPVAHGGLNVTLWRTAAL
ncbi:class I SAM-dependent RNA methyltransferase [Psychromarinibacter sp. C21-152]|uniref:Class I SAM-dependent RNA methyltransferase n=1 Tax=Psychromarinibacter sediminicola TaxID=3033385 RepID=A0AAE3T951_9RHOB|nr:class I SAM-dependent RNA methyltransferase [Psychromarinibacter sediminicola]MDF0601478.1 class I SAM-dependent RNA methyltransferase [Psychromarinibacter sediminicola]